MTQVWAKPVEEREGDLGKPSVARRLSRRLRATDRRRSPPATSASSTTSSSSPWGRTEIQRGRTAARDVDEITSSGNHAMALIGLILCVVWLGVVKLTRIASVHVPQRYLADHVCIAASARPQNQPNSLNFQSTEARHNGQGNTRRQGCGTRASHAG